MLKIIRSALSLTAALTLASAQSADIDLFTNPGSRSTSDMPNVLILVDNTANWNTAFSNEMAALSGVLSGLPADRFRIGIMMFTETGSSNSSQDGSYVRAAIRPLTATNKTAYSSLINSFHITGDKSNGGKLGKSMVEIERYYNGKSPYAGTSKVKTDYTGNTSGTAQSNAIYAMPGNALTSLNGNLYNSPIIAGCAKNYLIYISNGAAQDNNADTTWAKDQLATLGGNTSQIAIYPSGSASNVGDEWARYLKQSALNLTTYTIDVNKVTTGQGPGWTANLKSMAAVSQGKYFDVASSGTQITDALNTIFSEIQAVSSVFSSVSLPVGVNTQGSYLNQVYVGMFRPDANAKPRWYGNLKQYKFGLVNGVLSTVDADDASAINAQTGFLGECTRSYWTPSAVDAEWQISPESDCLGITGAAASNFPDGNVVQKGGQAYKLRQSTTRVVKTCDPASCTTLVPFSTTYATQARLGASSAAERDAVVRWVKGEDVDDENIDGNTTNMRLSVHGDVVHSRPAAINYGTEAAPSVVVFYGANDGALRAINGNRSAAIGATTAGSELWSFIPPESYGILKRTRDNTTAVSYAGVTNPLAQPKPYGMDGSVSTFVDNSSKLVFATMRRGGRLIYAFDVADPSAPVLKWRAGCPSPTNDAGCSTGLSGIGQTWSSVKTTKTLIGSTTTTLAILGGGYDDCEDADPHSCNASSKGAAIYILNADTGALVKSFATDRAVAGDITVLKNAQGHPTYAYAGDTGGNIYRVDLSASTTAAWNMTKIASLGCNTTAPCASPRKFLFAPDVIKDGDTNYLLIGSGDREKPVRAFTGALATENRFFMIKDKPSDTDWLATQWTTCGSAIVCEQSLHPVAPGTAPSQSSVDASVGWALPLREGEQVVTSSITLFGITTFSTHTPAVNTPGVCSSNLGTARVYNIKYRNAASERRDNTYGTIISGGGLPPSPVAGAVRLDNGQMRYFVVGASPDGPLQVVERSGNGLGNGIRKSRVYWTIQK